jgi:hypothetical protein
MTTRLVSAASRRTATLQTTRRVPLTTRAAAQHAGHVSAALDRVTTAGSTSTPGASAFQSAL